MSKGLFITFEGGEGSGKTTVIQAIAEQLIKQGYKVLVTREPGGIPIAEKIRAVILDKSHTSMDCRTEALLYAAARRQHLVEKVSPALDNGHIVLCDRFIDSSLAYQGIARGIGLDEVWAINQFAIDQFMPTLTLYLDIDPKIGLERIALNRTNEVNRLDLENILFHNQVREGYLLLADRYKERIVKVDAEQSKQAVFTEALEVINRHLIAKKKEIDTASSKTITDTISNNL